MKLLVFKSLWGMTGPLPDQLTRIAEAGYDGIEWQPPTASLSPREVRTLLADHGLRHIIPLYPATAEDFAREAERFAAYEPLSLSSQSGRDCYTRDEGCRFFEAVLKREATLGIPVGHETHRGKLLFTPWDTAFYLRRFPELRLVSDWSHWVNVCERLPDDQADALALAAARTLHIHGRVGYEEGPQVPDPSAPEYRRHLVWHETQWKAMLAARERSGAEFATFTPEYGPPNYLHTLPHTNAPVADLWQVCAWGMKRMREIAAGDTGSRS